MPLITTIGGVDSDSYVTVAEADAYLNSQLYEEAWASATEDNKEKALRLATRRLDMELYKGWKALSAQRLDWPRYGVLDPEGAAADWDFGFYDVIIPATSIPMQMKDAECLLASSLIVSNVLADQTQLLIYKSVKLPGPLEVEFNPSEADVISGELPAEVYRLINPFLLSASSQILRS